MREFLFADDLADALVFLAENYAGEPHVNVGTGIEISIADLAALIGRVVGYDGRLVFDTSRPDGMPRKVMDVGRLSAMGWRAKTDLEQGFRLAYQAFLAEGKNRRVRASR